MKQPLVATIFSDASVDQDTGAAGWGVWLKGSGRSAIVCGGRAKTPTPSVTAAEFHAIINGLAIAKLNGFSGHVMVQSDCLPALSLVLQAIDGCKDSPAPNGLKVLSRRRQPKREFHDSIKVLQKLVKDGGFQITVRHVRGHQKGGGRNWVNDQCDRIARKNMKEMRRHLRTERNPVPENG